MAEMVRRAAVVSGRVQGVGFRWATREQAQRLALAGFARNRTDGSVDVEAEGAPAAVDELVSWLRVGPPFAEVGGVEVRDVVPRGDTRFDVG
ncbi:MAG: acylphosphatase [Microbacteriaceae bacterium]|jgi:acylphosphatase|nr:acylphosphatase [Microbacteriaceae bacterium]